MFLTVNRMKYIIKMTYIFIIIALFSLILAGCSELLSLFDVSDRYIISFEQKMELSQIIREMKSDGIKVRKRLDIIHGVSCHLSDIEKQHFQLMSFVRYIEPDYELFMLDIEQPKVLMSKEYRSSGSIESVDWGVNRIKTPEVWNITTGKDVRVGVIDTGINSFHPDLRGAVIGGFDAINGISYEDDNNHGTYVASVIASRKNGIGIVGVAPEAMLYSIKAMGSDGRGYISDILDGCQWAIEKDIRVINMSLGSGQKSIALSEGIDVLYSEGIFVIAATGNEGKPSIFYPARNNVAICVGGSGMDDERMSWSNYGSELINNGVLAPGDWIQVANKDGQWQRVSGTSIATPHVTGIVALLMSMGCDVSEYLRELIFSGASRSDNPDDFTGHGIVNAQKSLMALESNPCK